MKFTSISNKAIALAAVAAIAAPMGLSAQVQEVPAEEGDVLTTVTGSVPADLEGLAEGPDVEGIISARNPGLVDVTTADGTVTQITLSPATKIRSRSGLFGINRTKLTEASLLNGIPIDVETVQWAGRLVATDIRFKADDLEVAAMIQNGTSQRFAQQGQRIDTNAEGVAENAAAAEALRGRFGDIDQYNVRGTTNVYFDTGKFNLSAQARQELCSAAQEAEQIDNALLLVVGYTDSTGSYEINQTLSERRAGRVVNFLQQECGWAPWRMLAPTGFAASDPAADNSTAEGKALNRRVAVNILVSKSVEGL